jgi:hypothetical protein
VVNDDVVGDGARHGREEEDGPADGVGGATEEKAKAGLGLELGGLGVGAHDPAVTAEGSGEAADIDGPAEEGGKRDGAGKERAVGLADRTAVQEIGRVEHGRPPKAVREVGVDELDEHERQEGLHAVLGVVHRLRVRRGKLEGDVVGGLEGEALSGLGGSRVLGVAP